MIVVLAEIELQEDTRDTFIQEFNAIVPAVRAEDGCIEYAPFVDKSTEISAQGEMRPLTVTIVEKWRDVPALERHLVAPHMTAYRERVKDFVKSTTLRILDPV